MKFSIEKSDFLAAINTATKALSSHCMTPILEGIYIEANDGGLRIMCSDGSLQIETTVTATVDSIGAVVLPGRLFGDIIRKLPDGTVEAVVKEKEGKVSAAIKCGGSKTNIQCMNAAEFPVMAAMSSDNAIEISQKTLQDMIKQTVFAASADQTRPVLTGVYVTASEGAMRMVALDGYRLALRNEPCVVVGSCAAVIPATSLNEIAKTLSDDDSTVKISFSYSNVLLDLSHTRINSTLVAGEFMKYEQILPASYLSRARANRKELLDAIERASLMARENKNNLIRFSVGLDKITIAANSELGNVLEELPISLMGNEIEIAFNSRYLTDVMRTLDDVDVYLDFNTNVSPCVIRSIQNDRFLFLVLPVRVFNTN